MPGHYLMLISQEVNMNGVNKNHSYRGQGILHL